MAPQPTSQSDRTSISAGRVIVDIASNPLFWTSLVYFIFAWVSGASEPVGSEEPESIPYFGVAIFCLLVVGFFTYRRERAELNKIRAAAASMALAGEAPLEPLRKAVRIRRRVLPGILSLILGGAGQCYNRQYEKGISMLLACFLLWFFFLGWLIHIWSIIDAVVVGWRRSGPSTKEVGSVEAGDGYVAPSIKPRR